MNIIETPLVAPVAPVIELPDSIALNGHMYTKNNLTPVPLTWYPRTYAVDTMPQLNTLLRVRNCTRMQMAYTENNLVYDNMNPAVSYLVKQRLSDSSYTPMVCKNVDKGNSDYDVTQWSFGDGWGDYGPRAAILHQSNTQLYVLIYREQTAYMYSFPKSYVEANNVTTYQSRSLGTTAWRFNAVPIAVDGEYFIFYSWNSGGAGALVGVGDKIHMPTFNHIQVLHYATSTLPTGQNSAVVSRPTSDGVDGYHYLSYDIEHGATRVPGLRWVKYNYETQTVDTGVVDHIFPPDYAVPYSPTGISVTGQYAMDLAILKDNDGVYYCVMVTRCNGALELPESANGWPRLLVFKFYDSNDPLKVQLIQETQISPFYRGCIFTNSGKTVIGANYSGLFFWAWDEYSKQFLPTANVAMDVFSVGVDRMLNIYAMDTNTKIYKFSPSVPAFGVELYFDPDFSQDAPGAVPPATTTLKIAVKDYLGAFLARQIRVRLSGNAVFASSNTPQTLVTTVVSGYLDVAVNALGPGCITAAAEII